MLNSFCNKHSFVSQLITIIQCDPVICHMNYSEGLVRSEHGTAEWGTLNKSDYTFYFPNKVHAAMSQQLILVQIASAICLCDESHVTAIKT